jgi:hypothetical protein
MILMHDDRHDIQLFYFVKEKGRGVLILGDVTNLIRQERLLGRVWPDQREGRISNDLWR